MITHSIQQVLREAQQAWMDLDGVEAVAQGKVEGQDGILVFISRRSSEIDETIPARYKSIPVKIEESGIISAG